MSSKHLEADALVYNVTALNDERSGKPIEKYARVGKREVSRIWVGSYRNKEESTYR